MHNNAPSDVIVDILVHLSVKSLIRYKCVSKHWCSLISDPRFVIRHNKLAMLDKDVECERRKLVILPEPVILYERGKRRRFPTFISTMYHVECEAVSSNDSVAVMIDCPLITTSSFNEVMFIGSSNGLFCLLSSDPDCFFLFNPAINELQGIPRLYGMLPSHSTRTSICGFGYDHSIDDYNLVQIMKTSSVYVYSLKTDTWRKAQNFPCNDYLGNLGVPFHRFISDLGVPLNGAVHWVFKLGVFDPHWIIAFDFAEGKFRELPRPIDAANNVTGLGVLGGCICWLTYDIVVAREQQYFWVMKEYGVKESWTKVFLIDVPFMNLRPLSYLKNGEALLEIDGRLVLYSPKERTDKEVLIRGINGRRLQIETYVESLVSPKAWIRWEELEEMSDDE